MVSWLQGRDTMVEEHGGAKLSRHGSQETKQAKRERKKNGLETGYTLQRHIPSDPFFQLDSTS